MPNYKSNRLNEDILRELTSILRELKDPRVANGMVSILRTELTNDLSHCKVYISNIEGIEKAKESVKGLVSAEGYIKRELSARIKMRKCPDLIFIPDDSIEHSAKINKMLKDILNKEENENKEE